MATSHYHSISSGVHVEKPDAKLNSWIAIFPHLLLCTIIVTFAAMLRAPLLNSASLWFDDAWVALAARMSATELANVGMTAFGFDAILWLWFKLVGFSEISAKLIPFAAGCLGPVVVYAMIIRKRLGWISALVAALILVVAPADVQYAATVKQYTVEALLTIFLIWLAWNLLDEPRRRNVIWLGAFGCFSVIVSGMMIFVVASAVFIPIVWTALKQRERRLDCVLVGAATLAFIAAWIPLMTSDSTNPALLLFWSKYYVIRTHGISGMAASSLGLAEHFAAGLTHRRFALVALAVIGAIVITTRRRPLIAGILVFPIIFFYLGSLMGRAPFGGGRTDIFLHPLLAVLAAWATAELLRLIQRIRLGKMWPAYSSAVAAVLLIVPIVRGARPAFPNHPEEDLRPLARHLMEQKQKNDMVLVYPPARYEWFLYSNEPFSIAPRKKHPAAFPYTMEAKNTIVLDDYSEDSSAYKSEIDQAIGANRIWLVASHLGYSDHNGSETVPIEARLRSEGYRLQSKEERARAFVELWVRPTQDQQLK